MASSPIEEPKEAVRFSSPLSIGGMQLKNRVVMSPMTRCRADADLVPTDRDAEVSNVVYYEQRASAGTSTCACRPLPICEATTMIFTVYHVLVYSSDPRPLARAWDDCSWLPRD